ncbi:MAG: hypothetical protein Sylvanvirus1_69 [Sylvanvirus sp.]|uniref:Uncharacterized protein n=1 Tax=Sylvanvirus sp. TaxID=2487774 RepID=A0A3G5AK20_9VIRU|nr:MAG: hypothetical protein Sylvanvirus1_69 [Sylvanvirus sp.]
MNRCAGIFKTTTSLNVKKLSRIIKQQLIESVYTPSPNPLARVKLIRHKCDGKSTMEETWKHLLNFNVDNSLDNKDSNSDVSSSYILVVHYMEIPRSHDADPYRMIRLDASLHNWERLVPVIYEWLLEWLQFSKAEESKSQPSIENGISTTPHRPEIDEIQSSNNDTTSLLSSSWWVRSQEWWASWIGKPAENPWIHLDTLYAAQHNIISSPIPRVAFSRLISYHVMQRIEMRHQCPFFLWMIAITFQALQSFFQKCVHVHVARMSIGIFYGQNWYIWSLEEQESILTLLYKLQEYKERGSGFYSNTYENRPSTCAFIIEDRSHDDFIVCHNLSQVIQRALTWIGPIQEISAIGRSAWNIRILKLSSHSFFIEHILFGESTCDYAPGLIEAVNQELRDFEIPSSFH